MNKKVLSLAVVSFIFMGQISLQSCSDSPTKSPDASKATSESSKPTAPEASAPSIVGKWVAIDMKADDTKDAETQKKMTASVVEEGIFVDFAADGKMTMGTKATPQEGRYVVNGKTLETTDAKGIKQSMSIITLTDKQLVLRDEEGKLNMIYEKK